MFRDKFGQPVYTEEELCEIYYRDPENTIKQAIVVDQVTIPKVFEIENTPDFRLYKALDNLTVEEFDTNSQQNWYMPDKYKSFDIAEYVLSKCQTQAELQRVGQELLLYQDRNAFMVLRYMKYLVDTMKEHGILWGVGRGSSVASYVLYLLEVHRIDSMYYDLAIEEFLR